MKSSNQNTRELTSLPVDQPQNEPVPFLINVDQDILDDLHRRLADTRWTDEVDKAGWDYGTSEPYLRELCTYWENKYDWRSQERMLNGFNHYKTTIDGTRIHFIHHAGEGSRAVPILLTHGYPDTFARFLKIIPLLTRVDEQGLSFDVVVPSIPGYGFSDIPTNKGMDTNKVAGLFVKLMRDQLGYEKFIAQGGDSGSSISEAIALYHGEHLAGLHLTDVPWQHALSQPKDATPAEKKFFKKTSLWQQTEGAYALIQSTKPQTLAYGLNDSPVGLAAWIIEKFKSWSDDQGEIENAFTKDELLTNVTIYWVTQTINSAFRLYYESIKTVVNAKYNPLVKLNPFDRTDARAEVPTAFALFPRDITSPPKDLANRFFNVHRWTEMPRGGHFAAMEQPELLAADIRTFVKELPGL